MLELAQSRIGMMLSGRWTLVRVIGVGGTACVYEARHRNGSRVAVKVLHPEYAREPRQRRRFFSEGHAANRVMHSGVAPILDEGEELDGTAFLVMELLSGESLDRVAQARGKLSWREVSEVAVAILDILAAAHDRHVVHRDLKPSNVFRCRGGEIKLLDFGSAKVFDGYLHHLTRSGTTVGTPAFMAPEVASGIAEEVDALSDIWALGATMFQLLSGRPVHLATSANQALVLAATRSAPPLRSVCSNVPSKLADAVDRALSYDKGDRFPNARSMQAVLFDILGSPQPSAHSTATHSDVPVSRSLRRAGKGPARSLATSILILAVGAGAWAAQRARAADSMPKTATHAVADLSISAQGIDTVSSERDAEADRRPASAPSVGVAVRGRTEVPANVAPSPGKPSVVVKRDARPLPALMREQGSSSDESDRLLDRWQ
jgi:eukaryotic-like serine/threonine-protein kinase